MENKINIAELLKDCPNGMELDCTMYEDCKFLDVGEDSSNSYLIRITTPCGIKYLDKYGRYTNDDKAKCVIFPKGKTTLEGFVPPCKFKDGDIIFVKSKKSGTELISIYRDESSHLFYDHCSVSLNSEHFYFMSTPGFIPKNETSINRLATEEEKRKLFDAIKENGCKWNAETKTLEKLIVPKFKVGDTIQNKETETRRTVTKIHQDCYECDNRYILTFENQDNWELVPNKIINKEDMGNGIIYDEIDFNRCPCADKAQLILGDDFEIKVEDGKTFVVRKKPQYPKTYDECCEVLFPHSIALGKVLTSGYNCELLKKFGELLICRDAYWKIAGEQMGLGKPWEPCDTKDKYIIRRVGDTIVKGYKISSVLEFPTAEMRDAFYENFKELIEQCKELL